MRSKRPFGTDRSLLFINTLLLSTALAMPAMAQIEEVVVTAQKRAEDIQTVPIAVTAYSSQDLAAHQITQFKDLQFSTPNVSYTKTNFTSSDFQIRGIGVTAVGYDQESGVAINVDNVFLVNPQLAEAAFFDLSDLEVLRGPQSTLYGRSATGGVVSVNTNRPDLSTGSVDLFASYGNYDAKEVRGIVNVPVETDDLGIRIAGDWVMRDGFTTNVFNNTNVDDRDQYSVRGEVRWQPTTRTTIDFVAATSREVDDRLRSQKQLCDYDPSGVLGCLPNGAATDQPVNTNSTLATIASSNQGLSSLFGPALGSALGLVDLSVQPTLPPGYHVPASPREISTDFDPVYKATDNFLALEWKQNVASWLDADAVFGLDDNTTFSQQSYNPIPGLPIDPTKLAVAEGTFLGTLAFLGGPAYAANFAPFFLSHPGELPISAFKNLGIISGDIEKYTNQFEAGDQSNFASNEYSAELHFDTKFDGPLNFQGGASYLHQDTTGNYYVNADTLDYPAIILGGFSGLADPACYAKGCIFGPGFYNNNGLFNRLDSFSFYGEGTWDIIPDLLKLQAGLRWTRDEKDQTGRIELYNGLIPIGTQSEAQGLNGIEPFNYNRGIFNNTSGHVVLNYTPKLDFTDSTLIYTSYSRGYKAGGFNPGIEPGNGLGVPPTYAPELIDAYELGTKNQLLGNTVQANGDGWYYNYTGLQVSKIENNTSVNENINAKLWGLEGEFIWQATDQLQFGLNLANTHTAIGNSSSIDPRNPSDGYARALLVKDDTISPTTGENCVLYYTSATPGSLPPGFIAPPGGVGALAKYGIPYVAYGSCNPSQVLPAGFSETDPAVGGTFAGIPVDLNNRDLQNTPANTISVNGQYTFPLQNDYNIVARVDYYWQAHMWGRIFDGPADAIKSWDVVNAQVTLNAPESRWYVQGFIKNIGNSASITGEYLTSPTSGLYTNAFYGDPRTYGVAVGAHF